ncbi:hypothetical protein PR048_012352 [Dryococelus australis]|uniref:Uncharacterized protein n=1 Tax=Dryococelus australis TaxID=614101 RepID=A0ABQ9HP54_9NEOP|nr:hypothetical protein PR048_012352 [Dryococelus australis]
MTCRLDSTVLCTNTPILTAHWLSAFTVEGNDRASVLQEVSYATVVVYVKIARQLRVLRIESAMGNEVRAKVALIATQRTTRWKIYWHQSFTNVRLRNVHKSEYSEGKTLTELGHEHALSTRPPEDRCLCATRSQSWPKAVPDVIKEAAGKQRNKRKYQEENIRRVDKVCWKERRRKPRSEHTKTTGKTEGEKSYPIQLVHTVFDTSWRRLAQSSPSTATAGNQYAVNVNIFVHKTVESSLQAFKDETVINSIEAEGKSTLHWKSVIEQEQKFARTSISAKMGEGVKRFGRFLKARSSEPMRVTEGNTEHCRNEKEGWRTGDPRENPPTSCIVRHDSHMQKSGSDPAGG